MTGYSSLSSKLFDSSVPKNPTFFDSLFSSMDQIKPNSKMDQSSFTEIFGELYFKEKPSSGINSPEEETDKQAAVKADNHITDHDTSIDSLLGTTKVKNKILDNVKDTERQSAKNLDGVVGKEEEEKREKKSPVGNRRVLSSRGDMPPPISCIGSCGKPRILFESIKKDGRFVLREIRIPTMEYLHASRKDGRFKLHLVQPDDAVDREEENDDNGEGDKEDTTMAHREDDEKEEEKLRENSDQSSS